MELPCRKRTIIRIIVNDPRATFPQYTFLAEFDSVQIEEAKSFYETLRGHGISQRAASNIVKFYFL